MEAQPLPADENEFPNKLGPFAILGTTLLPTFIGDSSMYVIQINDATFDLDLLRSCDIIDEEGLGYGSVSPVHELTLSFENKALALIPESAARFVWAYPLFGMGSLNDAQKERLANCSPNLSFLVFGGFIYFDAQNTVLQANAIAQGNGLYFSGPQPWRHEFTSNLFKQGRFQDVTIAAMRDQGAKKYCWLKPDEVLVDISGCVSWKIEGNGAFVYLFHEDQRDYSPLDRFFTIADSVDVSDRPDTGITSFSLAHRRRFELTEPTVNEDTLCTVCLENSRKILLMPCSHFCVCDVCAREIDICPLCRRDVEQKLNVDM